MGLVRLGAPTHGDDQGQRYVPLAFTASGSAVTAAAPATVSIAPPGYYMLFVTDIHGVPSVAKIIKLERGGGDTTPPTVMARAPLVDATNVGATANVRATFSEVVTGVSDTSFTLKNAATGASVASVVSRNGTINQSILTPNASLAADTRYTATLTRAPPRSATPPAACGHHQLVLHNRSQADGYGPHPGGQRHRSQPDSQRHSDV